MSNSTKQRHTAIAWNKQGQPMEIIEANLPKRIIKRIIHANQFRKGMRITVHTGTWEDNK